MKKRVSVPSQPSFADLSVVVLGSGCSAAFSALAFASLGITKITVLSPRPFFHIDDCSFKPTQLHIAGIEYVSDYKSAVACLEGGLAFLSVFGPNAWETLQTLGILEKEGTRFEFCSETLAQGTPSFHDVFSAVERLEVAYQDLKNTRYRDLIIPPQLFPVSPKVAVDSKGGIRIETIQPGIQIMRLGALLQRCLEAKGVVFDFSESAKTVERSESKWLINNRIICDVIINATGGHYAQIENAALPSARPAKMVKNNRYQIYAIATIPPEIRDRSDIVDDVLRTSYSLCTANATDPRLRFYGAMLDRSVLIGNRLGLILYAPGPINPGKTGGGSWGQTALPLDCSESWKHADRDRLTAVAAQIVSSVSVRHPWIAEVPLEIVTTHNGYNLNAAAADGRSDVRRLAEPEIVSVNPFFVTAVALKFTHSALVALQCVRLFLDSMEGEGINHESASAWVDLSRYGRDELTWLTEGFCKAAQVPASLIPFMSAPKNAL
ncbi:FAD-dependent oxidoreductase [bacterium]|nr:FAD-dependent oxidoreductase [bacterium]